ncbi:MAG: hypothetical protein M3Y81_16250 [Chloroflexota bacterium]|nr:hypothetical protein [Chloroflexota bacterium]
MLEAWEEACCLGVERMEDGKRRDLRNEVFDKARRCLTVRHLLAESALQWHFEIPAYSPDFSLVLVLLSQPHQKGGLFLGKLPGRFPGPEHLFARCSFRCDILEVPTLLQVHSLGKETSMKPFHHTTSEPIEPGPGTIAQGFGVYPFCPFLRFFRSTEERT